MRNDSILIANFATGVVCPPRIAPPRRRRPRLLAAGSPEAPAPPVPAPDTLPAALATRYRAARPSVRSVSLGVLSLVLDLPTGAQILRFELDACDLTPGGQVSLWFYRAHTPMGTGLEQVIEASTGSLATPGCDVFEIALPQGPLEVNNATEHYFLWVGPAGGRGLYRAPCVLSSPSESRPSRRDFRRRPGRPSATPVHRGTRRLRHHRRLRWR
jgi:hypothetical protein